MGHGGYRPGSGRKRKADAQLRLQGTWRPDRHGQTNSSDLAVDNVSHMPAVVDPRQDLGDNWRPSRSQRARLGTRGRQYLDDITDRYDVAIPEASLILTICDHVDAIDRLQGWQRKARSTKERIALEKLVLERQKIVRDLERQLAQGSPDAPESEQS